MQQPTRTTSYIEQGAAHADAVLALLKRTPIERYTVTQVADALDLKIADAGAALDRLVNSLLIDIRRNPYKPATYAAQATAQRAAA